MKLLEFQGKRIFEQFEVPVPESTLLTSKDQTVDMTAPVVFKSQVLVGGRGKAGGIILAKDSSEYSAAINELFGKDINGEIVNAVLVEAAADIQNEFYLALTFDGGRAIPLMIASAAGGVDIEQVAREAPEKIVTTPFNILTGPMDYQVRQVARAIGYGNARELKTLVDKMFEVFVQQDATLVEINPLAQTPEGLLALDSKILLDDNANFRNREQREALLAVQSQLLGEEMSLDKKDTITYVDLDGEVGMVSDGAGTGMLTLDLIRDAGGEAANFCEMGGITNPQVMYDAMAAVMQKDIKSLLIVLIGGFNRMDEMAEGILKYREDHDIQVPVVIRMCGTLEEVGIKMMEDAGIPTHDSLLDAVEEAVALAKGDS